MISIFFIIFWGLFIVFFVIYGRIIILNLEKNEGKLSKKHIFYTGIGFFVLLVFAIITIWAGRS